MGGMTFEQFTAEIDAVATSIGGYARADNDFMHRVRVAVAGEFHRRLEDLIQLRDPRLKAWPTDRSLIYTAATPADFGWAATGCHNDHVVHVPHGAEAVEFWRGLPITHYDTGLFVETPAWHFSIISVTHYAGPPESWRIMVTEFGARLLIGMPYAPKCRNAPLVYVRSERSIDRAVFRMADAFFGTALSGAA